MGSNIVQSAKGLGLEQNVIIRVIDPASNEIVSEHIGHNNVTNTFLTGIAHYITGDGVFNQGYSMLSDWIPRYISLGTMGLLNQEEDENGLPAGIGVVSYLGKKYSELADGDLEIIGKHPTDDYVTEEDDEHLRFVDYMYQRPGFGADGYDFNVNNNRAYFGLGPVYADRAEVGTINCELISDSFPRSEISFKDIVPEMEAEIPKTIDVVLSAMVSVGALSQFRESDKDYIFITEAGLWCSRDWNDSGANGLLAGYRISPTSQSKWEMSKPENRDALRHSIIKVKKGQVAQIIWKIQLGSVDQFGGIDVLYPSKVKKFWIELGGN